MGALLVLHAVLGLGTIAAGARLGRRALWIGAVGPVAAVGWLATKLPQVLDGRPVVESHRWVARLDLTLELRLDGFGALMLVLVSGIGVAVFAYAGCYFSHPPEALTRLAGLLTLFSGAMAGVVLADNLLLLYVCWELTSITSYLLIGNDHTSAPARAAALHALLVTSAGGLAMLAGFVLVAQAGGTYRLSALVADPPVGATVTAGLVLVVVGAASKSALYPFHHWLPGAMVAPTPVSAYLHSATMVKAGVYLIARFAPAFALDGAWRPVVLTAGLVTMVAGGLRALRQHDLKLLLAYGTVSQLGFLVVLLGAGTPEATAAGCVLLLAHGAFKAALFMVVGIIDHQAGTRDRRELPPLGVGWVPVKVVAVVAAASMAGLPLTLGFVAKEAALAALHDAGDVGAAGALLAGVVVGAVLTAGYSARFAVAVLRTRPEGRHLASAPAPSWAFVAPAVVLAVATVVLGVRPRLLDDLVGAAAHALDPATSVHLALWHGWNLPLALSAVAIAGGAVLWAARHAVEPVLHLGARIPEGTEVYQGSLTWLNGLADRVTGKVQSGSLPVYLGTILVTTAVGVGVALLRAPWPGWPDVVETPAHLPIVAVILGAALGASFMRKRFPAALLLGVVGYGMAGLFVVQGAPDLALTQAAIETLSTVVFVLVLRRLPARFERQSTQGRRVVRTIIASLVAAVVFAFALLASGSRTAEPVSDEMVARALPDGHGRNVVNVILVDFRGLDTLGEVTVLAAAAIGAVALARAGRRPPRPFPVPADGEEATSWNAS